MMNTTYYNFRIIKCQDGSEIIDERLKTPLDAIDGILAANIRKSKMHLILYIRRKRRDRKKHQQNRRKNTTYYLKSPVDAD